MPSMMSSRAAPISADSSRSTRATSRSSSSASSRHWLPSSTVSSGSTYSVAPVFDASCTIPGTRLPQASLHLQHQPVAAHRHDVVLQGLLTDRRVYEPLQRAGHPHVGVAKLPPNLPQRRGRLVEHLASRPDAGLDPAAYHAQVRHVLRHSRQPRRRLLRCAEGRTRALQHLHRLGDSEDVRPREDSLERRAFDQRRRVIVGVQADVGPVRQKREPLARLGLKGIDLLRSVGRAQIEGPTPREVEPRVPGYALPHGTEVERLHGLSPQPLVTAGARRPVAVLLNRCHGVVLPTVRFYQQAPPAPL